MDVLADVLHAVRLSGAVFLTADFSAPWSVRSVPPRQLAALLALAADDLAIFHVLAEGRCWVEMEGHAPLRINAGDVIVFPQGDQHVMGSGIGMDPTPIIRVLPRPPYTEMPRLVHGGGGGPAKFVCGYLHCDQKFKPLFLALPRLLLVRSHDGSAAIEPVGDGAAGPKTIPPDTGVWVQTTVGYMIKEASLSRPGSSTIMARLAELLFVEILRLYMQQLPAGHTGLLSGLNDPHMSKALALMHAEPARPWTVQELARSTGVSRSGLAERFVALVGEPPMRYLTAWRMQLAKQLLRQGSFTVAEVAIRVGYQSPYALGRAFKRHVGEPPASWRRVTARAR
jgi:AraC-like DNA-binding protein